MNQTDESSRRRFLKVSSMLSLAVAFKPKTIAQAFTNSTFGTNTRESSVTNPSATRQSTDKTSVRPFNFNFTEAELADLQRRINATKWPERELVIDASQGVQLATMQKLASYWGKDYTIRICSSLNWMGKVW